MACAVHICVTHNNNMVTKRDRSESSAPLRPVEFHILLSLAAGERYGHAILEEIEARDASAVPDVGTMYRALARMVESGLIETVAAVDDRRVDYRITPRGLRVAKAEAHRLEALARAARLGGLLEKKA